MKKLFIILLLLPLFVNSQTIKEGTIILRSKDISHIINLDGEWEFYPFKLYTPKDFKSPLPLDGVKYVKVPALKPKWQGGSMPDTGYGTYRLILYLPRGIYALKFQYIYTSAKIWANKKLIYESGKIGKSKKEQKGVYEFNYIPIFYDYHDSLPYLQLIIQVADFYTSKKLGITQSLKFGTYKKINEKYNKEKFLFFIILGILFFTFFYHLFLFIFFPSREEFLFLSLLSLSLFIRAIYTSLIFLPPTNIITAHRISFTTAILIPYFLFLIFHSSFKQLFKKYMYWIITIYTAVFTLFFISAPIRLFDTIGSYSVFGAIIISIYIWGKLFVNTFFNKKYNKYILWGTIAVSFLLIGFLNDVLFFIRVIPTGYISHYVFGIIVMFLTIFSTHNISNILKENVLLRKNLQKQNIILEQKIKERTEELEKKNHDLLKLSIIAQKTDNIIAVFDKNLKLEWANESFLKTYQIDFEKEKGKLSIIEFSNYPNFPKLLEGKLYKGESIKFQRKINTPNGEKWMQVILTPVIRNNQLTLLICIQTDITEIKKVQNQLFIKNKEIESNIRYAQTIQQAILGDKSLFKAYFDGYIIYKPKEIVSGDFYWFKKITPQNQEQFIYTALVDCTGHGVPGAFMSLIASRLLEEMITLKEEYNPANILRMLNIEIIKTLRQIETQNTDGFDIILIKIKKNNDTTYELTYASAAMPFYIYHKQQKRLVRYKGDVYHIGGVIANNLISFQNHKIEIHKDDIIYMISDGMINQLNKNGKKYGTLRLMKMLEYISTLPFEEQKEKVIETFEEWKNGIEQRDDMTFIAMTPKF